MPLCTRASVFSTAAAALIGLQTLASPAHSGVFEPEMFELDNGMQVVVVTNRSAPVVTHMVWYRVGAADETPGVSGIAHFLEHLMFRGTDSLDDGEFSRIVGRNGGQDNAFTSWDMTAYFQNVAVDRLPLVMEMEADRMVNLALDADIVDTERSVIIEERRERIDDNPSSRLSEQMLAALYQNHPYGRPIIGWEHEMAELSLEDAAEFYETWYAPNNAILIVSGDIDAAELRPLAERIYGPIPSRPVPERARPQEPEVAIARRIVLTDPNVQQPSWRRFYLAPSYARGATEHAYALQVLNEIFGAGTTSRLYEALVLDQGIAVGAGSAYSPVYFDETEIGIFVAPNGDVDPEVIEAAVDAEIALLLSEGVEEWEVESAKERLVLAAIYARDSLGGPARTLGRALTAGVGIDVVEEWPERIGAVTADDIMAAAHAVLRPGRSVTGLLLPGDPEAETGQESAQ